MPARWSRISRTIAAKEGIAVDDDALAMIARAAEGSVRDSLSILDQAIAHGGGTVSAEAVRRDARPCRPRAASSTCSSMS